MRSVLSVVERMEKCKREIAPAPLSVADDTVFMFKEEYQSVKKPKSVVDEGLDNAVFSNRSLEEMVDNASVTCMELLRLVESTKSRSPQFVPPPAPLLLQHSPFLDKNMTVPANDEAVQHPPHNYTTTKNFPVCLSSRPPELPTATVHPISCSPHDSMPVAQSYPCTDAYLSSNVPVESLPKSVIPPQGCRINMNKAGFDASKVKTEYNDSVATVNPKAEDVCLARVTDTRRQTLQNALLAFEQIRMDCVRQEGTLENEPYKRADLKAGSIMKERGLWLNEQKAIGDIPGVLVGDMFNYRMQMCLIGLHMQLRAGIDYISSKDSAFNVSIATSVVICTDENYGDDMDMGDTVVYTGQGGMARGGKKLPAGIAEDQKLVRGNVALKNSLDLHVPIRLIRGHRMKNHHSGIVYRYDGLYVIHDMKYEACAAGNNVFKFLLQRMKGQPPLGLVAPPQPHHNLLTYSALSSEEHANMLQNEAPLNMLEAPPTASLLTAQTYH